MYAIIRTGGKQAKVHVGDVLDVERLRAEGEVTFTPLLVVDDDGNVTSRRADLADVKVVAKVIGGSQGPKVDIFKYKAKTGYRRRGGHRQKYTQIEVVEIGVPGGAPAKERAAKAEPKEEPEAEKKAGTKAEGKPAAKTTAKPAAKAKAKPAAKAKAKPAAKAKPEPKTEPEPETAAGDEGGDDAAKEA